MKKSSLGFGKLFNVLQSLIGRMASRPMRNIETFPSKQMYLYLSLVERKVAEFYLKIDRMRWLVWWKWLIFITFSGQLMLSLKPTYMKRILHLVSVKNITFKSSYKDTTSMEFVQKFTPLDFQAKKFYTINFT